MTDTLAGLTGDQRNAYTALQQMLAQFGLQSLASHVLDYVRQGYDSQTINYLVQQTDAWHQRFAGNDIRIKNGLSALDPATYLATEDAYKAVMRNSGLPTGFYDSHDDFANFIGNNVSATELNDRVTMAQKAVNAVDPNIRNAFAQYYGVDSGHLAAYFLDPKQGTQILQQKAQAAEIGAQAMDQGLKAPEATRALQFAQQGVSTDQAHQGYQAIAYMLPQQQRIAERFGQQYGQSDAEDEVLGGLASAQRKRQQLNQQEQAMFGGSGGVGSNLYHPDYALEQSVSGAL